MAAYYTYHSNGSDFAFRGDKMTRHPFKKHEGATMIQVHALLTLDANDSNVYVTTPRGARLTTEELEHAAEWGYLPTRH